MARIRSVKPEFFKHLELNELENEYRGQYVMMVYAGLWTQCDKNGVFFCNGKVLKNEILPYVDFDIEKTLSILEERQYFLKYKSNGRDYGFMPNFSKYQFCSSNERKQPSKYPGPPKEFIDFQAHIETEQGTSEDVLGNVQEQFEDIPDNGTEHHTEPTGLQEYRNTGLQEKGLQEFIGPQPDPTDCALTASAVHPKVSKKTDLTEAQKPLFHAARLCFESSEKAKAIIYQDEETTSREMKHLKTFVVRCENIAPGITTDFMRNILEHFKIMCNGKYRGKMSFTPQNLITPWIWALVLDSLPDNESPELKNSIKGMFK